MNSRLLACALLCASSSAAAQEPFAPAHSRLAPRPAWEVDVTERLALASGDKYSQAMSRAARRDRVRGKVLRWNLGLQVLAAQQGAPLALEADEARVFSDVKVEGQAARFDRRDMGDLWFSGEGSLLLPSKPNLQIQFSSADVPHAYENGFGRLRLRPATVDEILRFSRDDASGAVRAQNRSFAPLQAQVQVRYEDFFGAPLGRATIAVSIPAQGEAPLALPQAPNGLYKTRLWGQSGNRRTLEYQAVEGGTLISRARPHAARLTGGWEKAFVPGPIAQNPMPATGWLAPDVKIDASNYSSHWMWARQKFTVPADFPAHQRVQLLLPPSLLAHARVQLDGQVLGEAFGWELPRRFLLPESVRPGSSHEIQLGITDYIVAATPGVELPARGEWKPGNRSLAGPLDSTGALAIGVGSVPEIVSIPATRAEDVVIRTHMSGGKRLWARASLQTVAGGAFSIRARVFENGRQVFDLGTERVSLEANASREVTLQKPWPSAKLWSPETPHLYELRTEVLDGAGQVLDVRRDRFGFREWSLRGGYFALNGEVVKLHGGSHIFPTALRWPAAPSPYRIMRHQSFAISGVTGGGQTQGVVGTNAADELGYIIKANTARINAHGGDNYAWQLPQTWARVFDANASVMQAYINSPSVVMWDLANEIAFRGPGEADKMGAVFKQLKQLDPTRFVTVGGSNPLVTDSEVVNYHGWGKWRNRSDYWFYRPEERPKYLRTGGYFQHAPANEPAKNWILDLEKAGGQLQLFPGYAPDLRHIGNRPALFAEGVYMENIDTFPLYGHDTFVSLPIAPSQSGFEGAWRDLNVLGNRRLAIQNVRQAGFASSMIHVSGGSGRFLLPVMSASWDRKFRFTSSSRMQTRFGVHFDLSQPAPLTARYRLFDGEKVIGQKSQTLNLKPGGIGFVDLDFALPTVREDATLRLEVRVWPQGGSGWFLDDVPITVFAPSPLRLPAGQNLALFDPLNAIAPTLRAQNVTFTSLAKLSEWNARAQVLVVGSEGLSRAAPGDLAALAPQVLGGGRAVVLDHFSLPSFLPRALVQSREALSYIARMSGDSPVVRGISTEDLRTWTTRENDQIMSWNPIETPSSGAFRIHATTVQAAPILEVGHGAGRVLFVQANFKDALGIEPAATRLLANLLSWTASPSPFGNASVAIVAGDEVLASGLRNRIGLDAASTSSTSSLDADILIASGTSPGTLQVLAQQREPLQRRLQNGATLMLYGLDENSARWLSEVSGSPVKIEPFPHRYAYLTQPDSPLLRGLGHGDFWINGLGKGLDPNTPLPNDTGVTGSVVASGPNVKPLLQPAYLSEIAIGKGRIVLNGVRSLESPVPSQTRVLSTLLTNLGARVDPDGANASQSVRWAFKTLDLTRFANRSLVDTDDPTQPRGYNGSGADDDLRDFPTGKQTLRGVDYFIAPRTAQNPNSLILLAGKDSKLGGVKEVKGIPVRARAERLYFLHNAAWGVPGFTYRVYYTEDRRVWIPGKDDPFVDVVVKPNENIAEWVTGGSIERGASFLPGASVAWIGGNKRTRANYQTGAADLGVYQMAWDNPHPEKEIESIDILSPGQVGSGNAFVFAITAANRDTRTSAPKPALAQVLAGADASQVLEQVQFANYGFVLMKDGTLSSIYDAKGEPFARSVGWKATASGGEPGKPRINEDLGQQAASAPQVLAPPDLSASRRVWEFSGKGDIAWAAKVIATPSRLRYELRYTPLRELKPTFGARLTTGLSWINGAQAIVGVNQNPFPVKTKSGESILAFDTRHTRWVFSYQLSQNSFSLLSPPQDGAPWIRGREEMLWWELSAP